MTCRRQRTVHTVARSTSSSPTREDGLRLRVHGKSANGRLVSLQNSHRRVQSELVEEMIRLGAARPVDGSGTGNENVKMGNGNARPYLPNQEVTAKAQAHNAVTLPYEADLHVRNVRSGKESRHTFLALRVPNLGRLRAGLVDADRLMRPATIYPAQQCHEVATNCTGEDQIRARTLIDLSADDDATCVPSGLHATE
eukprot:scaffold1130_cov195-Pinguiococcus_pyrenoidosus.AAC.53